jgi:hypothetical protein
MIRAKIKGADARRDVRAPRSVAAGGPTIRANSRARCPRASSAAGYLAGFGWGIFMPATEAAGSVRARTGVTL